jgi:hypothetical protein
VVVTSGLCKLLCLAILLLVPGSGPEDGFVNDKSFSLLANCRVIVFPRISGTSEVYLWTARREQRFGDERATNIEDYLGGLDSCIFYD